MASSEFEIGRETTTEGPRCTVELMTRAIVVSGESVEPLGVDPVTTIRAMTLCAPDTAGNYRPVRMTLATDVATTYVDDEIEVDEITMFAVGDTIGVVAQADPTADSVTLGVIQAINTVTNVITLTAGSLADVAVGDIVIVEDTEQMGRNAVLLRRDVPTLNRVTLNRIDVGSVGVIAGQTRYAHIICSEAGGDIETRIAAELPLFDLN